MDLRVFYQQLRKIESEIQDEFPVVVSRETPDGGKKGVKTQVSRSLAARMIVEEKAELASADDAAQFLAEQANQWKAAQEMEEASVPVKAVRTATTPGKKK